MSNTTPQHVSRNLQSGGLQLLGHRGASMEKELGRYIFTAAVFGGLLVGAISVLADAMGTLVPGSSIFVAVSALYEYNQVFRKEI